MTVLLGRTTAGTTADFASAGGIIAWEFTAVESGDVESISFHTKVASPTVTSVELGIYTDGGIRPGNLLGSAQAVGFAAGGAMVAVLATPVPVVAGTVYWLAAQPDGANLNFQGDSGGLYREQTSVSALPATWPTGDAQGSMNAILYAEDVIPPYFVSVGTVYANAGNVTRTPGSPAGVLAGDLLLVYTFDRGVAGTIPIPTGYQAAVDSAGSNGWLQIIYKIAATNGETLPAFSPVTGKASTDTVICQACCVRGVDPDDPIDVVGSVFSAGATAANIGPIPGITPGIANAGVILAGGKLDDFTAWTNPVANDAQWNNIGTNESTAGSDASMGWMFGRQVDGPSAIADKTFTVTATNFERKGVMFSLNPLPAASPPGPSAKIAMVI